MRFFEELPASLWFAGVLHPELMHINCLMSCVLPRGMVWRWGLAFRCERESRERVRMVMTHP